MEKIPYAIRKDGICINGNRRGECLEFLGIRYARAERFRYAELTDLSGNVTADAEKHGPACPQVRAFYPHFEHPVRRFYHKEFREGLKFEYDEDCLRLDIYTPLPQGRYPVMVFFHGGGFDSGASSEAPFDGAALAKKGVITVFAQYRLGVLGYFSHEDIKKEYGREGNFGLDDQVKALMWVKNNIDIFGGDPDNITAAGQSAGAISVQYLCLSERTKGLFSKALMLSGGGIFPRFALPRMAEATRQYGLELMGKAGCGTLEELRRLPVPELMKAADIMKSSRSDTVYNVMPVIDGYWLTQPVEKLVSHPHDLGYMIGYTNTDMYAPILEHMGNRFGKRNRAYIYFFDIDAPGDGNGAFHSCDLRYLFGTLENSWRPYGERDSEASEQLMTYVSSFMRTGDPNTDGLPFWEKARPFSFARVMRFGPGKTAMGHAHYITLTRNILRTGDPKA